MEDNAIVRLFWTRNEQAIPQAQKKYGNYCFVIAKKILNNSEDAEECVNDTYLRAWNTIPPDRPKNLSAFLGKITRNLALNRYRYERADKRGGGRANEVLDELGDLVSEKGQTEDEIERQELIEAINCFLQTLSTEKRKFFICRYWYFDSIGQIATRFGVTENYVSVNLNRVRAKLRAYLLERGFEL